VSNKAIKYRLKPDGKQMELFAKTFGCARKVWNLMLADKMASYKETGTFGMQTPAMYKDEYPYLKEVDSLALANVQLDLQRAIGNHCRDKKHFGFPHFKSAKRSKKSYTTNNCKGSIYLTDGYIRLPKAGLVKAVIHREPDPSWKLKSVTVSMEPDGTYYASVLFEYDEYVPPVELEGARAVGIDYKSDGLYVTSDGVHGESGRYFRRSQKRLAREQRKLSRKKGAKKGETPSNNYLKQKKKVAKVHRHVANQRKDYLHKLSTGIANQYDIVCVEDLNIRAMANKGFHNGRATMDNGNGMFLAMLGYKLPDRGKYLVRINRWYASSQICCKCGRVHPEMKDLTERIMDCECGNHMDRDENAAINIRNEGLRMLSEGAA
jgi:putative transposase